MKVEFLRGEDALADLLTGPTRTLRVPPACTYCANYIPSRLKCRVLNSLLPDCFVLKQRLLNEARGIAPIASEKDREEI